MCGKDGGAIWIMGWNIINFRLEQYFVQSYYKRHSSYSRIDVFNHFTRDTTPVT